MAATGSVIASLCYRKAGRQDVDRIVELVNSAYRGDSSRQGWTTEAELLGGQRTDREEVTELIAAPESIMLLGWNGSDLVGCVHLQRSDADAAYFGMFAIRPGLQGLGIGKRFMLAAERTAESEWGSRRMLMTVITHRVELIDFYLRRGYRRTGQLQPFPSSPRFGIPRRNDLQLELLEKTL